MPEDIVRFLNHPSEFCLTIVKPHGDSHASESLNDSREVAVAYTNVSNVLAHSCANRARPRDRRSVP